MKAPKAPKPAPIPTDTAAEDARRAELERLARMQRGQAAAVAGGDAAPMTAAAKTLLGA